MLGSHFMQQRNRRSSGIPMDKAALLLDPLRLSISVVVPTPNSGAIQIQEAATEHSLYAFRNESLAPVRHPDPITQFSLSLREGDVGVVPKENADAPHRFPGLAQDKRIGFWCRKHGLNDGFALLHTGVGRPSCCGANARIFGVPIQSFRIGLLPRPEK